MTKVHIDIIHNAKRKLRYNVLKINIITHVSFLLLAVILTYIFAQILFSNIENFDVDDINRNNQGIILIPFFVFWGLFYLLAKQLSKKSHIIWKFWVLKNIHYLQDFVEIRKIAEKKGYIKTNEVWLDKKYISKKKTNSKDLLDKLEIFEYAYEKNLEEKLPETLIYKVHKLRVTLRVLWLFLLLIILPALVLISSIFNDDKTEMIYGSIIFASMLSLVFIAFLIKWYSRFFIKTTHLEANIKGLKILNCEKKQVIPWEYIQEIKYDFESVGDDIVYFIYIYFKELSFPNKVKNNQCKVLTNILEIDGNIIFKQLKIMQQKYLDSQKNNS